MARLNIKLVLITLFLASAVVEEAMPYVFKVKSSRAHSAITLDITYDQVDNGVAQLQWNNLGVNVSYTIERSSDGNTFGIMLANNLQATKFNDTIVGICQDTRLFYRVRSSTGEVSNVVDGLLKDVVGPIDPQVKFVTINANRSIEIQWNPSKSSDVNSYQVYKKKGNTFPPYAAVSGSTFFIDNPGSIGYDDPCMTSPLSYAVLAVDGCSNSSSGGDIGIIGNFKLPLNTILLENDATATCGKKVNLKWNAYINVVPAITEYLVEESIDGSQFRALAAISPASPLVYTSNNLSNGSDYRYRVTAKNGVIESQSCIVEFTPSYIIPVIEIDNVTVVDDEYVSIAYSITNPSPDIKLVLQRKVDNDRFIDYSTLDGSGSFTDNDVNVDDHRYAYKLVAYDNCEDSLTASNEFSTIKLILEVLNNTPQAGFEFNRNESNGTYILYRSDDGVLTSYPIPPGSFTATNNIDRNNALNTYFFIEVTSPDGTTSRSNIVQLPSKIRMPTAFRPGGEFPLYKPVSQNIRKPYIFIIFNRWGQELFRTNNPDQGWDGSKSQPGTYAYRLTYMDEKGKKQTQLGWFIVVK